MYLENALCREKGLGTNVFHPSAGGTYEKAMKTCVDCVERVECAEYSIEHKTECFGMWGGLLAPERKEIASARARAVNGKVPDALHGTKQGWKQHIHLGQVPCDECAETLRTRRPTIIKGGPDDNY